MRVVFVGAGEIAQHAARLAIERGVEVVIVDSDRERIDALAATLDAGFIHGNGSHPSILREAGPEHTDILFCLTDDDLVNITAALIGRSLGVRRVVPRIEDESYEAICRELGLDDTIIPSRTIGRYLADLIEGRDVLELSTLLKHDARVFAFELPHELDGHPLEGLQLPAKSSVVCIYRHDEFLLPKESGLLEREDEILVITHSEHIAELRARFVNNAGRPWDEGDEPREG